jgi:hypothetical protein
MEVSGTCFFFLPQYPREVALDILRMEVYGPFQILVFSRGILVRLPWELCAWRFAELSKFGCHTTPSDYPCLISFSKTTTLGDALFAKCRIVFQTRVWSTLQLMKTIAPTDFPTGECEIKVAHPIFHETSPPRPLRFQCCLYVGPRCNAVRNKSRFLRGGRVRHLQH